jgi:DNA-binding GntR family transcriptional regulator
MTGELRPGERLHEVQLSTRFGISRGPLREATRSLQSKVLVEIIPNSGVFVKLVSPEEALEIYDVRATIFGLAGLLLTDLINDEMLQRCMSFWTAWMSLQHRTILRNTTASIWHSTTS